MKKFLQKYTNRGMVRIEFILIDLEDICSRARRWVKGIRWKYLEDWEKEK